MLCGCCSTCSQISARKVTRGSAATKPPSLSLRLASSETSTTTAAVRKYFVTIQGTSRVLSCWRSAQIAVQEIERSLPGIVGIGSTVVLAGGIGEGMSRVWIDMDVRTGATRFEAFGKGGHGAGGDALILTTEQPEDRCLHLVESLRLVIDEAVIDHRRFDLAAARLR